jgi:hypothetical protein
LDRKVHQDLYHVFPFIVSYIISADFFLLQSPTKFANKPTFHLQPVDKELVGSFNGQHILKVSQFTRKDLHYLFNVAHEMRSNTKRFGSIDLLKVAHSLPPISFE